MAVGAACTAARSHISATSRSAPRNRVFPAIGREGQTAKSSRPNTAKRMARGRLCVLSRAKGGGSFYHLQYRKDTKLHQRYVSRDEAPAYERATEAYRRFMKLVDSFVDEMSAKAAKEIRKEAEDAGRITKASKRASG